MGRLANLAWNFIRRLTMKKKTIVVTGGSKRIGGHIVNYFANQGHQVVFQYLNSADTAKQLLTQYEQQSLQVAAIQADLSQISAAEKIIQFALDQFGTIDLLINNASVMREQPLMQLSAEEFDENFNVNLRAPILLTQAFAKHLPKGHVINFLDRSVNSHRIDQVSYLLSKKALAEFTQIAALSLAPHFRVNGIAPGRILPRINEEPTDLENILKKIPLRREGTFNDITDAIEALEQMTYVTGQILYLAGGKQIRE